MGFRKALKNGKFLITSDVVPPKGTEVTRKLNSLAAIKGIVDGVNAADMPGACLRLGSLAMCVKLKEIGLEPILQITCRDRNRLSLMSELLSAHLLGIHNILVLGGDGVDKTDHPGAKAVFDLDSPGLLGAAKRLQEGFDLTGNPLQGAPSFCLGGVLNPGKEPVEVEVERAYKKAEAGAQFFQTQPVFDAQAFSKFLDKLGKISVPVLGGIMVFTSAKTARFFNDNIPGVKVPEEVINQLSKGDPVKASVNLSARLVRELQSLCRGVHIMMVSDRYYLISEILEQAV